MSVSAPRYAFGPFELDVAENQLLRDAQPVPLTGKALAVLAVLVERHGHLVEKQELLGRVWPDSFVEEAVLSVNVATIRRALGDDGRRYIETVPRRGYRFIGDVRMVEDAGSAAELDGTANSAPPDPEPIPAASLRPGRVRGLRWALAAGTVTAAVTIAIVWAAAWRSGQLGQPTQAPTTGNALAVLPLRNLSESPDQQRFADAMTDLLVTDLGRIGALKVVSRQSADQYAHTQKTLPEIARELGVDCIVEGTVLREGQRVRITAQLIHGPTDRQMWAQSYDRDLGDTLALQEEVAQAIAHEVGVKIAPSRAGESRHVAPAVYEAYLRGLFFLDEGKTGEAVTEFRRATDLDPGYAPAYTKIASAWFDRAFFGAMRPGEAFPTMREAALKALAIDDRDAEAHAWLATEKLHYEWDWAGAEREFRRSLALNPSDSEVRHMYAHYLLTMRRAPESMKEMDRAFENDPVGLGAAT